jgi:autotransporter-associated beta strand protein
MTNATWKKHPGSGDYDVGSNWSSGVVPDGTAFFGRSSTASLSFSVTTAIGGWTFKDTASHYSFVIPLLGLPDPFDGVTFVGAGIVVKGGSASITNNQNLEFLNASTAGIAHITNHSNVSFYNSSTAGSAKITNDNFVQFFESSSAGRTHITNNNTVEFFNDSRASKSVIVNNASGDLHFNNSSTASAARITNVGGGDVDFYLSSNAGAARISNAGDIRFHNTSSAANATLTNVASGLVAFSDTSGAGTARIFMDIVDFLDNAFASHARIAARQLTFFDDTNAGAAVITTLTGARTEFHDHSDGSNARFITTAGGTVDFSLGSGPAANQIINAGSIEGAGTYHLGANHLHVGFNNRSTNVSGVIDGVGGSVGGSLVKFGTGVLKLSHANNTYPGGTIIHQGTLDVAAKGAAGPGTILFDVGNAKQILKIENNALSAHAFSNVISDFGAGDVIDLAGLRFFKHAKATYDPVSDQLTVHSGKVTDTLTLVEPGVLQFKAVDDGHGGTKIIAKLPGAKPDGLANQHIARSMTADPDDDSFQFKHQAELGRHGATSFDPHLGLGTETLAFNEHVGNMQGMDHEPYLANFHIDVHHVANLAGHNFMV